MDILHIGKYYPPEPGGMETVLKSFAEATAGRLRNAFLVATREGRTRTVRDGEATLHLLRQRGTLFLAPVVPGMPGALHRLRGSRAFDAIVLHYPNPMGVLALAASLLARPKTEKIVVWHHADTLLEGRGKRALYALFRPLEEFVFRRADAFAGATPHHVPRSPTFGRFAGRSAILPYAVPDAWFDVDPAETREAEEVRGRVGGRYVLFVGRLVPYKGLDVLLAAADRIRARVVVAGTGPLREAIEGEIDARGLRGKVLLAGRVADLRPWYLGCDLLVLPSVSALEGFGIVQIEAMALGKPVVSSDLATGVTYVNRHGETGLTAPVGDADALARACNALLDDDALRSRMGEAARGRTLREFSYSALADRAVALFRGLCGNAAP